MMDMGFWPDVRKIAEAMPPSTSRQTMLFSATMPEEVMRFADALAPNAVFVQVGSRRGPAQTISHEARILPSREKVELPREVPAPRARAGDRLRQHEDRRRSAGAAARRQPASAPRRFTPIDRRRIAPRRSRASAPAAPRSSSPPTSPRAASTSTTSASSSTTKCRTASTATSTASAAPAATTPPATPSRSPTRTNAQDLEEIERAFGLKLRSRAADTAAENRRTGTRNRTPNREPRTGTSEP